ncbi:MAG: leucine-rich repeat domain-containing protein [Saprospiraceae bacterium]|nr:leucine-rich repeat domain-containing protein [Saprospiraceae bacterium]
MKKQHFLLLLIAFLLWISLPSVMGQNKPCNNFDCAYKKADNLLKNKEYQKALDNLDSAEGYLTDTNTKEKEQIKQLRRRLFVAIEQEKEDAKRARDEAKRQTEIAKTALAQVEIEKQTAVLEKTKADSLFKISEYQKIIAQQQTEIAKVEKVRADQKTKELEITLAKLDSLFKVVNAQKDNIITETQNALYQAQQREESYQNELRKIKSENDKLKSDKKEIDKPKSDKKENKDSLKQLNTTFHNSKVIDTFKIIDSVAYLEYKNLESTPSYIFNNHNLRVLTIHYNEPNHFPIEICNLKNLTQLNIRTDNIGTFPIEIGKLTNLTTLSLSWTRLMSLPPEIKKLKNLEYLYLQGNLISKLPDEIKELKNLKLLDISITLISPKEKEKIEKLLPNCKIEY